MIDKQKLKQCLENILKRPCKEDELINAEKDVGLLYELLEERVEALEKKIIKV